MSDLVATALHRASAETGHWHQRSALGLIAAVRTGQVSPAELAAHFLERITRLDGRLHSLVHVAEASAQERAARPDLVSTLLAGLPIADKDLSRRAGQITRSGSRVHDASPELHSDQLTQHLDAAGAVSLGRTASAEYGMTGYTEPAATPATRNPWDVQRGPGGSSGGAASAVAARLLPFAPASDGGGSVRIPAAATGLVGIKPSRGALWEGRSETLELSVPGPIARTVVDAAVLLTAMARPTTDLEASPWLQAALEPQTAPLRIGVLWDSPWRHSVALAPEHAVVAAVDECLALLRADGHHLHEVHLVDDSDYADVFTSIWANLAAGVPSRSDGNDLTPFVQWLRDRGQAQSPEHTHKAYARAAAFAKQQQQHLARYDVVISPTLALTARPIGWFGSDPEADFRRQCQFSPYTSWVNVAGLPALTVPVALSPDGLPIGIQLIGRLGADAELLPLAARIEAEFSRRVGQAPGWD